MKKLNKLSHGLTSLSLGRRYPIDFREKNYKLNSNIQIVNNKSGSSGKGRINFEKGDLYSFYFVENVAVGIFICSLNFLLIFYLTFQ